MGWQTQFDKDSQTNSAKLNSPMGVFVFFAPNADVRCCNSLALKFFGMIRNCLDFQARTGSLQTPFYEASSRFNQSHMDLGFVSTPCGLRMSASSDTSKSDTAVQSRSSVFADVASSVAAAALRITPVRRAVMSAGRAKIVKDAGRIGIPWNEEVNDLRAKIPDVLDQYRLQLEDPHLANTENLPAYYLAEFHAYENGNLGWEPALEGEVSSRTVHSKQNRAQPLDGDGTLRGNSTKIAAERWASEHGLADSSPKTILDIGCSVGLSCKALHDRFSGSRIVGVDASSHMLAVGAFRYPEFDFLHALAEKLPEDYEKSFDVVSISLVLHEVPNHAIQNILLEAYRALRAGGMLCIMDSDPSSFDAISPVILTLFRSTEPYFDEHAARDMKDEMEKAGFHRVESKKNTLSHVTFTAFKP